MTDYDGFTVYEPDDLYLECDPGYNCGTVGMFLRSAIEVQLEQTEEYLCEANAKEMYAAACVLERLAGEIREKWEEWKLNDFQKSKDKP